MKEFIVKPIMLGADIGGIIEYYIKLTNKKHKIKVGKKYKITLEEVE